MEVHENPTGQPLRLIDNPNAGELFVDHIAGVQFNNGNFTITLSVMRNDHSQDPAPQFRQVVGRLVVPADAAHQLSSLLGQFIQQVEKRGLVAGQPAPSTIQ